jgi:hypothetical protein
MIKISSQTTTEIDFILQQIHHLSEIIGGRGSCSQQERITAQYACEQLHTLGMQDEHVEQYDGAPSTYRPFMLAFTTALLGSLAIWINPTPSISLLAVALNMLGAWGMLAETDLANNWMRWLLPTSTSHNAVGSVPPVGKVHGHVILCAHIDTHRTPVFYSSKAWHKVFGYLVGVAFISMPLVALLYLIHALTSLSWLVWLGTPAIAVQLFALALCVHADFTPFSPGANDNASGVAVTLSIAHRVRTSPLQNTQLWFVFTGCEETGAHGMTSFLDEHSAQLGNDAFYIILDQVGAGNLEYLLKDGLIIKRDTHTDAVKLAEKAAKRIPHITVKRQTGIAYTDAMAATRRGLKALTLVALPPANSPHSTHWHQMSDRIAVIQPDALQDALEFTWACLQEIDQAEG